MPHATALPNSSLHAPLCEIRFARFAVGRISSSPPTPEPLLNSRVSRYFKIELSHAVQQPSKHLLGIAVWIFVHLILREKSGCAVVGVRANVVLGNRQRCYDYHLRVTHIVTLFETILKTIAITAMTPERPLPATTYVFFSANQKKTDIGVFRLSIGFWSGY